MICTQKRLRLCTVWLVLNILFIWGNSLMPGEISKVFSDWVGKLLAWILGSSGEPQEGQGLLRKLAHFMEFCSLGVCLSWLCAMRKRHHGRALLCGFLVACTDEIIQCAVPDRGPAVLDVVIDTAGVCLGIALLLTGYTIYQKRKNNKILEETTT